MGDTHPTFMSKLDAKPLSLSATLRDLALLRASEPDVALLLPTVQDTRNRGTPDATDLIVERSYQFVQQARAAIKLYHRGDVENVGEGVEAVRTKTEELSNGLESA
jgi:hypothetical protein